jgi:DnaK suppressor protein
MAKPASAAPYSAAFIEGQRQRLKSERAAVAKGIEGERADLLNWSKHDDTGIDQHMADDATALTEQEMDVTLIDNASYILSEIDEALHRIGDGSYGWDEESCCWIREERLMALPWARREIEGQRRLEDKLKRAARDAYDVGDGITDL